MKSLIIVTYNEEKEIKEIIKNALSKKPDELIIVNDGSTDNTMEVLLEERNKNHIIRIVNQPKNGIEYSKQIGISHAKYKAEIFYPYKSKEKQKGGLNYGKTRRMGNRSSDKS
jgi:glycosyltransferase involved in cell wall biosynthesis